MFDMYYFIYQHGEICYSFSDFLYMREYVSPIHMVIYCYIFHVIKKEYVELKTFTLFYRKTNMCHYTKLGSNS
jgi:hypothetical protein